MFFRDIIGQNPLQQRIRSMVDSGKVPHALLFHGPEGVGKLPLALATAQYLCCTDRHDGDACGKCPSCMLFKNFTHPDIHFAFPISKSKEAGVELCSDVIDSFKNTILSNPYISINEWMSICSQSKMGTIYTSEAEDIIRKFQFKPYCGGYKILIMWLPEKMQTSCANSLLKLVEEPAPNTLFLFVSNDIESVLGTIVSRCQPIEVPPIDNESLRNWALSLNKFPENEVDFLVKNAGGSVTFFNDSIENNQNKVIFDYFRLFMRLAWSLDVEKIRDFLDEIQKESRETHLLFFRNSQRLLRENFILLLNEPDLSYMSEDEADFASKFSKFIHERNVVEMMEAFELAEAQVQQNVNVRIILFHLFFLFYKLLHKSRIVQ